MLRHVVQVCRGDGAAQLVQRRQGIESIGIAVHVGVADLGDRNALRPDETGALAELQRMFGVCRVPALHQ